MRYRGTSGGEGGSGTSGGEGGSGIVGGAAGGGYVGEALPQGAPFLIFDPLIDKITEQDFHFHTHFPWSAWRPDLFGAVALAEFGRTDWRNRITRYRRPPRRHHVIMREVEELIGMARDERRGLANEILDQNARVKVYFAQVMMLSAWSHPNTLKLIEMAYRVAQMLGVHFKLKYNRARPQQVFPALIPLIDSPWHASFPSAHSLESHMIARALAAVSPGARRPLRALANRIGRNREVAGVHYPSDTLAGRQIAREAFPLLLCCPIFHTVLCEARKEPRLPGHMQGPEESAPLDYASEYGPDAGTYDDATYDDDYEDGAP
jgi:membrane-associated phospholipid phosphatase